MEYNIEKINQIGKLLAEVIEEEVQQTEGESVRIGNIEMALRENLLAIGQSALKHFLENADGELEAEIECACGANYSTKGVVPRRFGACLARWFIKEHISQAVLAKTDVCPWIVVMG